MRYKTFFDTSASKEQSNSRLDKSLGRLDRHAKRGERDCQGVFRSSKSEGRQAPDFCSLRLSGYSFAHGFLSPGIPMRVNRNDSGRKSSKRFVLFWLSVICLCCFTWSAAGQEPVGKQQRPRRVGDSENKSPANQKATPEEVD